MREGRGGRRQMNKGKRATPCDRAKRIRRAKEIVLCLLLVGASVTAMALLYDCQIRTFNRLLWVFGTIGFFRVMMVMVTWLDDITIDNNDRTFEEWAARRGQ